MNIFEIDHVMLCWNLNCFIPITLCTEHLSK